MAQKEFVLKIDASMLEEEIKEVRKSYQEMANNLAEVLAVLNRDGGHYQEEHGIEEAIRNGINNYYDLVRERDELKRLLEQLENKL